MGADGKQVNRIEIHSAAESDYPELVTIWEAAVHATLTEMIEAYLKFVRPKVLEEILPSSIVLYAKLDSHIVGFVAVNGKKLEMLYVLPEYIREGIGKKLFWHAVLALGARYFDVLEQNESAMDFYLRLGCQVTGRSTLLGMGQLFPVFNMSVPGL